MCCGLRIEFEKYIVFIIDVEGKKDQDSLVVHESVKFGKENESIMKIIYYHVPESRCYAIPLHSMTG